MFEKVVQHSPRLKRSYVAMQAVVVEQMVVRLLTYRRHEVRCISEDVVGLKHIPYRLFLANKH